jgi:hypothetical protein
VPYTKVRTPEELLDTIAGGQRPQRESPPKGRVREVLKPLVSKPGPQSPVAAAKAGTLPVMTPTPSPPEGGGGGSGGGGGALWIEGLPRDLTWPGFQDALTLLAHAGLLGTGPIR